eukprot:Selendium_serpulae@DN6034_c0_g1_i5.p1
MCPDLLENKDFPPDVVARAKRYLTMTKSFGGYTHSKGLEGLRLDVGAWLERRDGYSASCEDIYLTNGASSGVVFMLEALMTAIVNPPIPGDASFESFSAERDVIMSSLKRKAKLIEQRLNSIPGVSTQRVTGAMYAFPSIDLSGMPEPADGKAKDAVYCMKMLEETGIVTVPGSGFGQQPGTHHFRITILPDEQKLPQILDRFE